MITKRKYILYIFALFLVIFAFGCSKEASHLAHKVNGPQEQKSLYQCPMHPQITSEKPGECPICGMDLVLAEKSKTEQSKHELYPKGHAAIDLSLEKQQMIGVKTQKATRKKLFKKVMAPGRVAFDPELYTAQSEYLEALRQVQRVKKSPLPSVKKNARQMVESARIRLKVLGLSDEQIRILRPSTRLSEELLVHKKGQKVWIYAEVFEMDLRNIEKGQVVAVSSKYLGSEKLTGSVVSTDEVINPKTRTAKVRIEIKKASVRLRPESYVDVNILVPLGEHLSVSEDALIDTGEEIFAFVSLGEGKFEPRKVKVLFHAGDNVAISEGISDGEEIVTSANFLIDSESRLKGVLNQMSANHQH